MQIVHFRDAYKEDIPRIVRPVKAAGYIREYLSRRPGFYETIFGIDSFLYDAGVHYAPAPYQIESIMEQLSWRLESGDFLLLGDWDDDGFDTILFFGDISSFEPSAFRERVKRLPPRPQYGYSNYAKAPEPIIEPDTTPASETPFELIDSGITQAINAMMGAGKQVVNDVIAAQRAAQAEWFAEQGIIKVTDTQTNQLLTPEQVSERYTGVVTFDIDSAEQRGADTIQEVRGYSAALLALELVGSKGKKLVTDPQGLLDEVKDVALEALKDARSSAEALGHLGGNHAVKRLELTPDERFINRYHGPDGMYYDVNGKRVEAEFKGYNTNSNALSTNTKEQKQGSNIKNRTRAEKMQKKQSKVNQPSNRQGGEYTEDEQTLWGEILNAEGRKNHLAVFTNTETGQVRAFSQDKDGNLVDKVLDEPIPHFNDAKALIDNAFSGKE
ncbi:hypothetical protein WOB61_19680 [Vibrio parahaemolyticus]